MAKLLDYKGYLSVMSHYHGKWYLPKGMKLKGDGVAVKASKTQLKRTGKFKIVKKNLS